MATSSLPQSLTGHALETRTQELGRALFELARRDHARLSRLNRWTKQVLSWCLSDQHVKIRVLRFLDVLPSLRSARAIASHVSEYFPTDQLRLPSMLRVGVSMSGPGLVSSSAVAATVRQLVEHVARQFIAGTTVEEAAAVAQRLAAEGLLVSFDVLGEQVVSEQEAQAYAERYLALLNTLSQAISQPAPGRNRPSGSQVHLSIKPSALTASFDPLDGEGSLTRALVRLEPIVARASELGASLTLDMEQYELRDLTLELTKRLLERHEQLNVGIVIQSYLCDAEQVAGEFIEWLLAHKRTLSIRLVKGAYWDSEVALAAQRGWPIPVYREKGQTDEAFERLTRCLLAAYPTIRTEVASHNLRSVAHAMAAAEATGLSKERLEFQLLYGMGETIQGVIRQMGYPVRIYAPIGELIPGMGYLVRRILENTANESFLRQDLWEHAAVEDLLRPAHILRP